MLNANGVKLLVDVRTVPKSRTNPQASPAHNRPLAAAHAMMDA